MHTAWPRPMASHWIVAVAAVFLCLVAFEGEAGGMMGAKNIPWLAESVLFRVLLGTCKRSVAVSSTSFCVWLLNLVGSS